MILLQAINVLKTMQCDWKVVCIFLWFFLWWWYFLRFYCNFPWRLGIWNGLEEPPWCHSRLSVRLCHHYDSWRISTSTNAITLDTWAIRQNALMNLPRHMLTFSKYNFGQSFGNESLTEYQLNILIVCSLKCISMYFFCLNSFHSHSKPYVVVMTAVYPCLLNRCRQPTIRWFIRFIVSFSVEKIIQNKTKKNNTILNNCLAQHMRCILYHTWTPLLIFNKNKTKNRLHRLQSMSKNIVPSSSSSSTTTTTKIIPKTDKVL